MKMVNGARALVALATIALVRPAAHAETTRIREDLRSTSAASDARGKATVVITHRGRRWHGKLELQATHLAPATTFAVSLGGIRIGTLDTSSTGAGHARFETDPKGHDQLLGTDPRGKDVSLTDDTGKDHLVGSVPADSIDPNAVRCCVGAGAESACDAVRSADCTARGGQDLGAGTCVPNPCQATPVQPGDDIRCCKPGDQGTQCDLTTAAECSAALGTNIGPGACDSMACGGTPVAGM